MRGHVGHFGLNHNKNHNKNILVLREYKILALLHHCKIAPVLFKVFHDVQVLQLVQLLQRRIARRGHNISELIDSFLEWRDLGPAGNVYNLLKDWIAVDMYVLQVRVLVHVPADVQFLLEREQLLFEFGNFFEFMTDALVFLVV